MAKKEPTKCRVCRAPLFSVYDQKDGRCVGCRTAQGGAAILDVVLSEEKTTKGKPQKRKMKTITLKVPDEEYTLLEKCAKQNNVSVNKLLKMVIDDLVQEFV